jgi:hypothetical protein
MQNPGKIILRYKTYKQKEKKGGQVGAPLVYSRRRMGRHCDGCVKFEFDDTALYTRKTVLKSPDTSLLQPAVLYSHVLSPRNSVFFFVKKKM